MRACTVTKKFVVVSVAILTLLIGMAATAMAQTAGTASINGTVRDPKGLVVPGASVVVRNVDTGIERPLTTNNDGIYAAPFLQPGHYEVRTNKEGLAEVIHKDILLEVGQSLTIDFDMPLKAAEATVTVTGEPALVDTEKTEVSQTIAQYQVENLPLNGRRWDNLVLLTPGVSADGGFGLVSFRGISGLYNNNMVDGADNNQAFFSEARGRTRLPYGYSLDAIKEFNVITAAYSAEFGRAAGGAVNAVTKSGTNEWHGDVFYFIRDAVFLARDPVNNGRGLPKPDERRQQFGGGVGGPIFRDKLFFFADYDQQKRTFPVGFSADANFYDATVSGSQANVCENATNPVTGMSLKPACIAAENALKPITNALAPRQGNNNIGLAKLDYQLNSKNHISSVVNILRWDSPNGIFTGPTASVTNQGNGTDGVHNQFVTTSWTSVISATLVNEARFQWGEDFEFQTPNHSGPTLSIAGLPDLGMPNFLPRGAFPDEQRYQWVDNLSWVRGRHQFKMGMDINHVIDNIQNLFNGGGGYSYDNVGNNDGFALFVTDLVNAPNCLTNPAMCTRNYSSFVQAGDPITGSGKGSFNTNDLNFYFQDNLKWRPNVTLYMGLRYELQTMPSIVKANPLIPESSKLNTDRNNFGPRVGFAWDVGGHQKEVLRGGYGLYYGRTQNSTIFNFLFQNGIFQQGFSLTPGSAVPPGCTLPFAPNTLFPQPSTAPAFSPIFSSAGPTPTAIYPTVAAFIAACGKGGAVADTLDPHYVNPLVHEYDITYEQELPWHMSISASYLGSRGNHLPIFVDANLPPPDKTSTYLLFDGSGKPLSPAALTVPFFSGAVPRPRAAAGYLGPLVLGKSVVNSWYNGMVIRVRRREIKGLSIDANYTLSKARDNGQVAGVNGTFTGTVTALNPFDLRGEYGRSEIDIRHRFILNWYWLTPFGNWTDNEGARRIIGGWKLSGVYQVQGGRPVTAGGPFIFCGALDGGLTCGEIGSFGTGASGRVPFVERNEKFSTPIVMTFDLRLAREFKFAERLAFEPFVEAFNLFNRTNAVPSSGIFPVSSSAFDRTATGKTIFNTTTTCPTAAGSGIPDLKGCLAERFPPHTTAGNAFLHITSTGNLLITARQVQFGAKFRF